MRVLRVSHSAVVGPWRERERELRRLGVDVTTLTAQAWEEGGRRVPLEPEPGEPVVGVRTWGRHPCGFLYDPRPIWRALRHGGVDVIDVHEEPYSLPAAEVLALRCLAGSRAPAFVYTAQNLDKRRLPLLRWFAGAYPCNEEAAKILRRRGFRGRIRTLPLGIPERGPAPPRPAPGPRPRIGFAGRLVPEKGASVLLRAAAAEPGWDVTVAGDGPQRRLLEATAPPWVRFEGSLASEEMDRWYAGLDVLVVPSLPWPNWAEQFGRVVVEAQAAGVPVVASDTGALPDVVAGGGVLVAPGDADALRAGVARVLADPFPWIERGRAQAARCTWPAVAAAQRDLFRGRLESPEPLPPVQVAVVAYGRPELLARALDAVAPLPVLVVDNSSSPAVRAAAAAAGAAYDDPGANLGFAAAANRALRRRPAGADVLLLNPDAVVDAGTVLALQRRLRGESRLAAVAPAQQDRVGWPFPSPAAAWVGAVGLGRLRRAQDFLVGAVLLLRSEAIDEVGELDERFFLYAEETDWQRRAREAGWGVRLCPDLAAEHVGAATSTDPGRREDLFAAGEERYIRKWHGAAGWQAYRAAVVAGALARAAARPGLARTALQRARRFVRGPLATATR